MKYIFTEICLWDSPCLAFDFNAIILLFAWCYNGRLSSLSMWIDCNCCHDSAGRILPSELWNSCIKVVKYGSITPRLFIKSGAWPFLRFTITTEISCLISIYDGISSRPGYFSLRTDIILPLPLWFLSSSIPPLNIYMVLYLNGAIYFLPYFWPWSFEESHLLCKEPYLSGIFRTHWKSFTSVSYVLTTSKSCWSILCIA